MSPGNEAEKSVQIGAMLVDREARLKYVGNTYLEIALRWLVAWMARRHTATVTFIAGIALGLEILLHTATVTVIVPIMDVLFFGHDDVALGAILAVSTAELVRRAHWNLVGNKQTPEIVNTDTE